MSFEILAGLVSFAALVIAWALIPTQAEQEHKVVEAPSPAG